MKTLPIFPFLLFFLLGIGLTAAKAEPVKVLLVTGIEYHDWRSTAPQIAKQLQACPDIEVRLATDFNILCSDEIFDYDVMFFNFCNLRDYNTTTRDDELAIGNIEKFLKMGKGVIIYHLAIGIFEQYHADRIQTIIGRNYDREAPPHDPFQNFEVRITKREHPIMKNIPDFKIDDELYTCIGGDRPIEVLAEATSSVLKTDYPMAHIHKYGDGSVFTTVLGHDTKALRSSEFVTILRNATLWLAKRDIPTELATVVSPARPIPTGKYYPPDEASNKARVEQLTKKLPQGEKILLYLDCGREWEKAASSGESFSVVGDSHRFPGSQDAWENDSPNQEHIAFGNPAVIHIDKLDPKKKYRIGFSWWDFDCSRRTQSVTLHAKEGDRKVEVVPATTLPNFAVDQQVPEVKTFDIDAFFVKEGGCDCHVNLVQGPNAVINEIWLIEVR